MDKILGTLFIGLWFAAIGGWFVNLLKFVGMIGNGIDAVFIARCIGILFWPLGGFFGWVL